MARLGSGYTVTEFVDNSVSASSNKIRPAYAALTRDAKAGRFDVVMAWDLDRLTRKPREMEDWIDLAQEQDVNLLTVSDSIDLRTDNGRMYVRIKAAVARAEVDRKSTRQVAANLQRAEAGIPITGRRPFGFEADRMTVREEEAQHIREAYAGYLAGVSVHALCRRLNDAGVLTSRGSEWTTVALRHVLRRPANAGLLFRKGVEMPASKIEAIVPRDVWEDTVKMMDTTAGVSGPKVEKGLLSNLMFCVCGAPMVRKSSTSQGDAPRRLNYLCSVRAYPNKTDGRRHVSISAAIAERVVTRAVIGLYLDGALDAHEADAPLRDVQAQLADVREDINVATDALLERDANKPRIRKRLAELAATERALIGKRDERLAQSAGGVALEAWRSAKTWPEEVGAIAPGLEAWEALPIDSKRDVIRAAVRVDVTVEGARGERVRITPLGSVQLRR